MLTVLTYLPFYYLPDSDTTSILRIITWHLKICQGKYSQGKILIKLQIEDLSCCLRNLFQYFLQVFN